MIIMNNMNPKEWVQSETLKLIHELQNRRCLWDALSAEYRDRNKKRQSIDELARLFDCDTNEIERKIHNLKSQFQRELSRVNKTKASSVDSEGVYKSKWFGYRHLLFLAEVRGNTKNSDELLEVIYEDDIKHETENGIEDDYDEDDLNLNADLEVSLPSQSQSVSQHGSHQNHHQHLQLRKRPAEDPQIDYVLSTLKTVGDKMSSKSEKDEFVVFGEYVASELKKLNDKYVIALTKRKIHQALFEADLHVLGMPPPE